MAIIGESGSGKTTLLKLISGEYDLFSGKIFWNGKQILGPSFNLIPGYDFMKTVSQEFDLMPFVSVEESVGRYLSNFFPEQKIKRTEEVLEVVGLNDYSRTPLTQLSGGQKQRVALARALAKAPEVLLLDEPFSHIDSFKKQQLRRALFKYLRDQGISVIVATHDKQDVLGFAEKMLVLDEGKAIAMDSPEELFRNPPNTAIASFFAEYNLLPSHLLGNQDNSEDLIVYAHQIRISQNPQLIAKIIQSRFNGFNFFNEAIFDGRELFFYSDEKLDSGLEIGLEISR